MRTDSKKIALCGLTAALSVVILLMGFLFPFATYACPAAAACLILPIVYEYKEKTAFTLYAAISFLAFFLVPDKELTFMFVFVFGLYTVIKFSIDRKKSKVLKLILKLCYVNCSLFVSYGLLLLIFPVQSLVAEFGEFGMGFIVLFMALFNVVFLLYDKAVEKVLLLYIYRFRSKIFKR
ncbi:MAG: hypothetical protein RR198_04580 [Oscillospiraceae bacterium]